MYLRIGIFILVHQELPGGYGRVKPDVVTYGSGVRGSSLKYVHFVEWFFLLGTLAVPAICVNWNAFSVFALLSEVAVAHYLALVLPHL